MPIEIKELHIRVAINASPSGSPAAVATAGGSAVGDQAKDAITAACVEQVLQILQSKMER